MKIFRYIYTFCYTQRKVAYKPHIVLSSYESLAQNKVTYFVVLLFPKQSLHICDIYYKAIGTRARQNQKQFTENDLLNYYRNTKMKIIDQLKIINFIVVKFNKAIEVNYQLHFRYIVYNQIYRVFILTEILVSLHQRTSQ